MPKLVLGSPQNPGQTQQPNPNCLQNAVVGSPGIGRPFEYDPTSGLAGHDGAHALSPAGRAASARTLAPLAGTVIRVRPQEPGLSYMDVRLDNPINGVNYVVRYKDLASTSATIGQHLEAGEVFGTVRPASDPINRFLIGLHVTLVRADAYAGYRNRVARGQYSNAGIFLDPLGPKSPINCPGVKLTK